MEENNLNQLNSNNNSYVATETSKKEPIKSSIKLVIIIVVSMILSSLLGAGLVLLLLHFHPDIIKSNVSVTKQEKEVTVTDTGIADGVEKVYDSVVVVKTYNSNKLYATGTGFIYKQSGNKYYIITNYHVIQGGSSVSVLFTSGNEEKVSLVNGDKYADIAVLSYETSETLTVAEMGSSEDMRVGDTVFAIGAPLDSDIYSWSVTRGILSGKDRMVEVSTSNTYTSDWIMQVIQTDAAINTGNSGGPLCNANGEVVGVTNMKLVNSGVEGMGFAIPIEEATSYADALITGEDVSRPYMGISMVEASNKTYASKYSVEAQEGVLIENVASDSPAAKAGLKTGDIIVSFDDEKIDKVATLRYKLYKYKVGDTVTIKYIRNGKTNTTKLTLTAS